MKVVTREFLLAFKQWKIGSARECDGVRDSARIDASEKDAKRSVCWPVHEKNGLVKFIELFQSWGYRHLRNRDL